MSWVNSMTELGLTFKFNYGNYCINKIKRNICITISTCQERDLTKFNIILNTDNTNVLIPHNRRETSYSHIVYINQKSIAFIKCNGKMLTNKTFSNWGKTSQGHYLYFYSKLYYMVYSDNKKECRWKNWKEKITLSLFVLDATINIGKFKIFQEITKVNYDFSRYGMTLRILQRYCGFTYTQTQKSEYHNKTSHINFLVFKCT